MRLCFLNYDGFPTIEEAVDKLTGGLNTILFNLSVAISKLPEVEGITVAYRLDRSTSRMDINEKLKIVGIPSGPPKKMGREETEKLLPEFINSVGNFLETEKPELVHTCGSEAGLAMSTLRDKGGIKIPWVHSNFATLAVRRVVVEKKSSSEATSDLVGRREQLCVSQCDKIIALSGSDRDEICAVFGLPHEKVAIVTPGVDHSIFHLPSLGKRRPVKVISAGRISGIKDFPFLLRAFETVVRDNPQIDDLRLEIIGGTKEERDALGLVDLAKSLDIGLVQEYG